MPGDALTKKHPMMDATMDTAPKAKGYITALPGEPAMSKDPKTMVAIKKVGRHAGTIAHVVTHVVGNDRGVARIVFGNACLHLAHQVGTHVGPFGKDAPT
jgi:hypothetical protein